MCVCKFFFQHQYSGEKTIFGYNFIFEKRTFFDVLIFYVRIERKKIVEKKRVILLNEKKIEI